MFGLGYVLWGHGRFIYLLSSKYNLFTIIIIIIIIWFVSSSGWFSSANIENDYYHFRFNWIFELIDQYDNLTLTPKVENRKELPNSSTSNWMRVFWPARKTTKHGTPHQQQDTKFVCHDYGPMFTNLFLFFISISQFLINFFFFLLQIIFLWENFSECI